MASMEKLLLKLYEKNIKISVENEKINLKISDNKDVGDLIEEVKKNKQNLIEYITQLNYKKDLSNHDFKSVMDTVTDIKLQEIYEASPQQKREYLRYLIIGKHSFNIVFKVEIPDSNIKIIEKVIFQLLERHEILRTTFAVKDKKIHQKIHPQMPGKFAIECIDLTERDDKEDLLTQEFEKLKKRKFDFEKGPLLAVKIIEYDVNIKGVLIAVHHVISDIVSVDIIMRDIQMLYQSYIKGEQNSLPPLNLQSKEYALWINNYIKSPVGKNKAEKYKEKIRQNLQEDSSLKSVIHDSYTKKLKKELKIAFKGKTIDHLPDFFGNIYNIYPERGALYQDFVDGEQMRKLSAIAKKYKCSLFNIMLAISSIVFHKKNNNESIRIAIPHSGRHFHESENVIGWLASEMILCLSVKEKSSFKELVGNVSDTLLETSQYSFYPYEKIMLDMDLNLNTLAPLFLNYHVHDESYDLEMKPLHKKKGSGHFTFGCDFIQYNNCIKIKVEYNKKYFSNKEVQKLIENFKMLIDLLFDQPDAQLSELFL